jgi:hypothetical protein
MPEPSLDATLNATYVVSFAAFFVYGQRIETSLTLFSIRRKLNRIESFKNESHHRPEI